MTQLYSKDLITNVLNFFKNGATDPQGNFYSLTSLITSYQTDHTGVTITPLTNFEIVKKPDFQFPYGVLYENQTQIETYEVQNDLNKFDFALNFADQRADLNQLRTNLYAYRDSCSFLINHFRDLGGVCIQAYRTVIKPPLVMQKAGNYTGVIEIDFQVWDSIHV